MINWQVAKKHPAAIWGAAIILLLSAGSLFWLYLDYHPSTDDAYVQANIVNIAAQVSGPVANVYVQDHQQVKKGQLLFTIDPRPFQLAVDAANAHLRVTSQQIAAAEDAVQVAAAQVTEQQAKLTATEKNSQRILTLVKKGLLPQSTGDDTIARLNTDRAALVAAQSELQRNKQKLGELGRSNAEIQLAEAQYEQENLNLQYTKVYAPTDGTLIHFNLRPGTMVTNGQPLFALVEKDGWWVEANFKETDLAHIRPNQSATIQLDTYPDIEFKGIVQAVSIGSGAAFALLPPENATGNWVKVTQRFPVKILFVNPDPRFPLRVGASSSVTIDAVGHEK